MVSAAVLDMEGPAEPPGETSHYKKPGKGRAISTGRASALLLLRPSWALSSDGTQGRGRFRGRNDMKFLPDFGE